MAIEHGSNANSQGSPGPEISHVSWPAFQQGESATIQHNGPNVASTYNPNFTLDGHLTDAGRTALANLSDAERSKMVYDFNSKYHNPEKYGPLTREDLAIMVELGLAGRGSDGTIGVYRGQMDLVEPPFALGAISPRPERLEVTPNPLGTIHPPHQSCGQSSSLDFGGAHIHANQSRYGGCTGAGEHRVTCQQMAACNASGDNPAFQQQLASQAENNKPMQLQATAATEISPPAPLPAGLVRQSGTMMAL